MRNRDLLQNWMRKNAVSLINPEVEVRIPDEGKQALKELPEHLEKVRQGAEDIGHGLDETGKGLQEVGKGTQQLATTGDNYDKAVSYLPWIGTGLFSGGLLGALLGGKYKLLGSVIGATGGATAGGIAKYLYDQHGISKQATETSNAKLKAGDEEGAGLISYLPPVFLFNKVKQLFDGNENSKCTKC